MQTNNNCILQTIFYFCTQCKLKKITTLSKRYHRIAQRMLIHRFGAGQLQQINEKYHFLFNFHYVDPNRIPPTMYEQVCILSPRQVSKKGYYYLTEYDLITLSQISDKMINLHTLYLNDIGCWILPDDLCNMPNLKQLWLDNDQIQKFPDSIAQLTNLRELSAMDNCISRLPQNIGQLTQLENLWLSYNVLHELPDSICFLKKLETLDLDHNMLRSLPTEIGNLSSLRSLLISNNKLKEIPDSLGILSKLEYLSIDINPMEKLPLCIERLPNLKVLKIDVYQAIIFRDDINKLESSRNNLTVVRH